MTHSNSENATVSETIQRFGIGRTKLYELIQAGNIEAFKLGRRTLIRVESVRVFIDSLPRAGR